MDPYREPIMTNPISKITLSEDLVSKDKLLKTEFHHDLLSHYDLHHLAIMPLHSDHRHFDVLSAWRGESAGEFDLKALNTS